MSNSNSDEAGVNCKYSPDGSCENCLLSEGGTCPYEEDDTIEGDDKQGC